MPRAFTHQEKEEINRQLLEQGAKLFSAYGIKKTNIEDIARAAGISKGAFYIFYPSKEDLFMAVIEQAETRIREGILASIRDGEPGSGTPRFRLFRVLKNAFGLLKTIPLLQFFSGSDFEQLFRKLPAERLQHHLAGDTQFFETVIARCQESGIPIRLRSEAIVGLLYPLVLAILHEDELSRGAFSGSIDLLLELAAAYCLGEIDLEQPKGSQI